MLIEQQESVEMPQRRKLSRHRASVILFRKQMIHELAHVFPTGIQDMAVTTREKRRPKRQIVGIRSDRKPRQAFLYLQVVDKACKHSLALRRGGHESMMPRYRTQ